MSIIFFFLGGQCLVSSVIFFFSSSLLMTSIIYIKNFKFIRGLTTLLIVVLYNLQKRIIE